MRNEGAYQRAVAEMNGRMQEYNTTPWWRVFRRMKLKGQIDALINAAVYFQSGAKG